MFGVPDHDAEAIGDELGGVPAAGLLRRRRDRPGRRRELPARLHRDRGSLPAVSHADLRRAGCCSTGATGGLGQAIARELAARGARARAHRPAHRRARAARGRDRRPRCSPSTSPTRAAVRARRASRPTSTSSSPTRRCRVGPARRRSRVEQIDRALDVNLRAPIVLAHELAPRDGRAAAAATRLHLLAVGQGGDARQLGLQRDEVRPARLRAEPARATCTARGVGVTRRLPGLHPRRGDVRTTRAPSCRRGVGTKHARGRRRRRRARDRARPRRGRRRPGRPARGRGRSPGSLPASPRRSRAAWARTRSASRWPRARPPSADASGHAPHPSV